MRIMVSGGNGYVGRTLSRLLTSEHEVCVVDNLRYGRSRFTDADLAAQNFKKIDIRDREQVAGVMASFDPEAIIHLAAIHYIPECENEPDLAVRTNVEGTVNLMSLAPSGCRFVFASSAAVYAPESQPHHESRSPIAPMDIYGLTKLQGEEYLTYFAERRHLEGVIVRLFNVVGPGETNPHVLPEIFAQLIAGKTTIGLGNLTSKRDYVDVRDAASGFRAAALNGSVKPGETVVVNLGTMVQWSVEEMLEKVRDLGEYDFSIVQDQDRMRAVDRPFMRADNAKIGALFQWQPQYGLDDAISAMVIDPDLPDSLVAKYQL